MGFPRLKPTSLAWQVEFFHWAIREGHDKPRQHILKSRDITLPRKVCTTSQSCYFSSGYVQIWELDHQEGWMPKIDAFELWCWKRLLRLPWTVRRSNQKSTLSAFIESTDAEAEAPILWPPDAKSQLIRKDPDAGENWRQEKKGDDRGWDGWMTSLTQQTRIWANSWRQRRTGKWCTAVHGVTKSRTRLSEWTTRNNKRA